MYLLLTCLSEDNILASVFISFSSSSFPTNVSDKCVGAKLGEVPGVAVASAARGCCLLSPGTPEAFLTL